MLEDIKRKFLEAEIELTDFQLEKMEVMIEFLTEYNKKVNLTAIKDREGIIEKHLVDSVLPLKLYEPKNNAECLDIGTGAGFPGVPMMIYRPDLKFTLLDARRKRTDYLNLLAAELEIMPEEIIHGRAEELGSIQKYRERYDMITARAVSDLLTLLKYALPMLKKGGTFLAMRGSKEEMSDTIKEKGEKMGLHYIKEILYNLPDGDRRRLILFVNRGCKKLK